MGRSIYDDYEIVEEVGQGAFARVYRARQRYTGQDVAIKVLPIEKYDDEMKNIVKNEINIMRIIARDLPNLKDSFCQIIDVVEESTRTCVVMEYLAGGELFDRIVEQETYSEKDASIIMTQLVNAIDALHSLGIVHRDLKPENIVFANSSATSNLKVMDFGLALTLGDDDPHEMVDFVGSPGYVAPEVLTKQLYSFENDIWSMGVLLFILLVGYAPFHGTKAGNVLENIVEARYSLAGHGWEDISDSAKDLVRRMLTVDIRDRITIEEILEHPWMTHTKSTGPLTGTLTSLRNFNGRRIFRVAAEQALGRASNSLRNVLLKIVEKTHPAGFTVSDITKIAQALKKLGDEKHISCDQFVECLEDIGFEHLPLQEIFTTLADHRRGVLCSDAEEESTVDIDELVVGLSVIAALESREKILEYLFKFFSTENEENDGFIKRSIKNVLQVLASYEKPAQGYSRRKRHIINNLGLILGENYFTAPEQEGEDTLTRPVVRVLDQDQITYERFKYGIIEFGDDVLRDFVFNPFQSALSSIDKYTGITRRSYGRRFADYFSNIRSYSKSVFTDLKSAES